MNPVLLSGADTSAGAGNPFITMGLPLILMLAAMYFIVIMPQNKKKKKEDAMRNSLEVGDNIITIGGIMGRIVSIKEDTDSVIIETGADRAKMQIKKWAIAGNVTEKDAK